MPNHFNISPVKQSVELFAMQEAERTRREVERKLKMEMAEKRKLKKETDIRERRRQGVLRWWAERKKMKAEFLAEIARLKALHPEKAVESVWVEEYTEPSPLYGLRYPMSMTINSITRTGNRETEHQQK